MAVASAQLRDLLRARERVAKGFRPVKKPMPQQEQPDLLRGEYAKTLLGYVRDAQGVALERLGPVLASLPSDVRADAYRLDAGPEDAARRAIRAAARDLVSTTSNARVSGWASAMGTRLSDFQRQQLRRQFTAAFSIDILGAPAMRAEPFLALAIQEFTEENVGLIRSVSSNYFADLESRVVEAIRAGTRGGALAEIIRARTGVAESSAKLVARDQLGKFYGALNERRQGALGVTHYFWSTSRDNRVREEHGMREGQRFSWADPPEDGHPGHPINCRCHGIPDVAAVLASL